eukprot:CAMPEP_0117499480 /NCGR_PEP_ID=MMETSP0784-20121206/22267_1 /TAXON_ID=39447 /ORGANISM="" /LENGTH=352 /DNA_ID=CAMNT_0005294629 /DNA_START=73 /DNA_END=1128 /DNA_ORIENTATION=+
MTAVALSTSLRCLKTPGGGIATRAASAVEKRTRRSWRRPARQRFFAFVDAVVVGGSALFAKMTAVALSTSLSCLKTPGGGIATRAASAVEKAARVRWRLHLMYDGTDYSGWQRQSVDRVGTRTVQGVLDRALSTVFRTEVRTVGTSRTDRGVHARGQVCHFETPMSWHGGAPQLQPRTALMRLRRALPTSLFPAALGHADPSFHARLSATRKHYSYRLATVPASPFEARYCWHCGPLDFGAMLAAADAFNDRLLDFSSFTANGAGPFDEAYYGGLEKVLSLALCREGRHRVLVGLSCERFLYKMCRRVVGALVEVGRRRMEPDAAARASRAAVPTAPPQGLCLDRVEFPLHF